MLARLVEQRAEFAPEELPDIVDAAVEINRRDERLVAIRQQRLLAASAGLLLAAPEQQVLAELQTLRQPGERRRRDERGLRLRLLAFVPLGELAEEHIGDDEAEHRVAEKLQRLVVDHAAADV